MDKHGLYIIDTSSLIGLHNWRPPAKHRSVWEKLDRLVDGDRLISPQEVYEELRAGKDAIARWATRRKKTGRLFVESNRQCVGIAKQIIHKFPDFIEADRPALQAD